MRNTLAIMHIIVIMHAYSQYDFISLTGEWNIIICTDLFYPKSRLILTFLHTRL